MYVHIWVACVCKYYFYFYIQFHYQSKNIPKEKFNKYYEKNILISVIITSNAAMFKKEHDWFHSSNEWSVGRTDLKENSSLGDVFFLLAFCVKRL